MTTIRRYLQYLWLRGVHYRRIVDYIGNIEGSAHYQYIRRACGEEYSKMCRTMPASLKKDGLDMIFRNLIMAPFYYAKICGILWHDKDPVMIRRVNRTMRGPTAYLLAKVALVWTIKLFRDSKAKILNILKRIKWHNNGIAINTVKDMIKDIDFDCIIMANKLDVMFSSFHTGTYEGLSSNGLKPLFIFFGKDYSVKRKDSGYVVEIPLQMSVLPRYSRRHKLLLKEAVSWVSNLDAPMMIRGKIISEIRNIFPHYIYIQEIAAEVLGAGKARCVLTFAENHIDYRTFLWRAKKLNLPTLLYHPIDGVNQMIYEKYDSDIALACNRTQYQFFTRLGYAPERCNVVGSFNLLKGVCGHAEAPSKNKHKLRNILYFTKGTKAIDEAILDELTEKLKSLNVDYSLIIKKHPKDVHSFRRFRKGKTLITDKIDYTEFLEESDLIVSQYSGVVQRIILSKKPVIVYTYSDILEFGERVFFQNAPLPNYVKYVQNKNEFHYAIEELFRIGEPQALPQKLTEDLYGYIDTNCGSRIAEIVGPIVNGKRKYLT